MWEALLLEPSFTAEHCYSPTNGSINYSHFCIQVLSLYKHRKILDILL